MKFVCHDHQDASVFAIVVQVEDTDSVTYKLYCYQAEQKVVCLICSQMMLLKNIYNINIDNKKYYRKYC